MSQTRAHSFIESVTNVVVGYGVALGAQLVVFPLFGMHVTIRQNLGIGLIFTGVSLARSYCLRRLFNYWTVRP